MIRSLSKATELLCLLGITISMVYTRLLPDNPVDEGCTSPPIVNRCPDGVCRSDCALSKMPFGAYCSSFSANYQCHNGSCVSSYTKCLQDTTTDMGSRDSCSTPKYFSNTRCPDGYCRVDCNKYQYSNCPMKSPISCGDGRCVTYEYECGTMHCPFDRPYMCPDMTCQGVLSKCRQLMSYRPSSIQK